MAVKKNAWCSVGKQGKAERDLSVETARGWPLKHVAGHAKVFGLLSTNNKGLIEIFKWESEIIRSALWKDLSNSIFKHLEKYVSGIFSPIFQIKFVLLFFA